MKRTVLVILCTVFTITTAFSQGKPIAKFEKTTHDFGQVSEEDGNVTYKFAFTNDGDAPLVVSNVTASCGCTTPDWTKEPIPPKGKGFITVTYGASGRPGPIGKTVSVYTNQGDAPIVLSIKGNVNPKGQTPEQKFPLQIGDMRLRALVLNYGNIAINNSQSTQILEVYNAGKSPLALRYGNLPKYITIKTEPASIPANTEGKLIVTFNAPVAKLYGKYEGSFGVIVNNNTATANNKITYMAVVTDDFSKVNSATAPKIGVGTGYFNFGPFSDSKAKAPTTQVLKLSNSGQSDLLIRRIVCDNPSVSVSIPKSTVKKGEIVDIKVTVQPKKIKEVTNANLTIVTNDPVSSVRELRVTLRP